MPRCPLYCRGVCTTTSCTREGRRTEGRGRNGSRGKVGRGSVRERAERNDTGKHKIEHVSANSSKLCGHHSLCLLLTTAATAKASSESSTPFPHLAHTPLRHSQTPQTPRPPLVASLPHSLTHHFSAGRRNPETAAATRETFQTSTSPAGAPLTFWRKRTR